MAEIGHVMVADGGSAAPGEVIDRRKGLARHLHRPAERFA
jgi:hypothetical protein